MKATLSKLGDAIDVLSGFAYEAELFNETEGLPVIRIRDVVRGFSNTRYSGEVDAKFIVQNGEILIGMDGNFNTARWTGGPALLNQRVCKVTARADILDEGFLFHLLPKELKKIEDATAFVTVKHLSVKGIRDIEIVLPPLPEQRRIAAILDQADALRVKRREALAQLDNLSQSIFIEMFGDPIANSSPWATSRLGLICKKISDGTHHSPTIQETGVPYITAKHLKNYGLDFFSSPWFVAESDHRQIYARCDPKPGDVLYIKDGATTGIAAINPYNFEFSMLSSLALLRPNLEIVNSSYLCHWLNSPTVKTELIGEMAGAAIRRLTLAKIKAISIPTPPIQLQVEFAQRMSTIEGIKEKNAQSLVELDTLFASLQHRAFRGEL